MENIPKLEGAAAAARDHQSGHMQIIASAGSGKTETVSQRIANLVAGGVEPASIVAFTFTKKAAAELKDRIRVRVEAKAGVDAANKLGQMYVGTIHGFCFNLLTTYVAEYEAYEAIDENQFSAFMQRYSNLMNFKQFEPQDKMFKGMAIFNDNLQVVENELIPLSALPEEFAEAIEDMYQLLDQHRFMTFGMQIDRAVAELEKPEIRAVVGQTVKYLIVDEYQDVNPAQERLIQLLAQPLGSAELVVVGDDDQSIYQWRGSTVANITTFAQRYEGVSQYQLLTNRRSRPAIVRAADKFAQSIPGRLPKQMLPHNPVNGPAIDWVLDYETEAEEAGELAQSIQALRRKGFRYSEMAILVRASTAYPPILKALEDANIPVNPGDRQGLFDQPDADFLGRVFAWFADSDWKPGRFVPFESVELDQLLELTKKLYGPKAAVMQEVLEKSKDRVGDDSRGISLVDICYEILDAAGVENWDTNDLVLAARLGTIARFTKFVADYEGVAKRARLKDQETGEQVGSSDQGVWYFRNLASLLVNYALGKYKDFGGEDDLSLDAVDLMTVHAAKGLEWPIVFLPSLTAQRFPSSRNGTPKLWLVPTDLFDHTRYEGTDQDERRLFYVAVTRAKEWLSLSAHQRVSVRKSTPSPYLLELVSAVSDSPDYPHDSTSDAAAEQGQQLQLSFSQVADYLSCGLSFWLRQRIGFPAAIAQELGYGKAVHHVMRLIAEQTQRTGRLPNSQDVDRILAREFFLPFASKALSEKLRTSAGNLVHDYLEHYSEEMNRVWQTERPFELAVPGALIAGRADVILQQHDGVAERLAIVDYKTSVSDQDFSLQAQVYAEAGIREGLEVAGAYIHGLSERNRVEVDISPAAREQALAKVQLAVTGIKERKFEASPSKSKCGMCDVRAICRSSVVKK